MREAPREHGTGERATLERPIRELATGDRVTRKGAKRQRATQKRSTRERSTRERATRKPHDNPFKRPVRDRALNRLQIGPYLIDYWAKKITEISFTPTRFYPA